MLLRIHCGNLKKDSSWFDIIGLNANHLCRQYFKKITAVSVESRIPPPSKKKRKAIQRILTEVLLRPVVHLSAHRRHFYPPLVVFFSLLSPSWLYKPNQKQQSPCSGGEIDFTDSSPANQCLDLSGSEDLLIVWPRRAAEGEGEALVEHGSLCVVNSGAFPDDRVNRSALRRRTPGESPRPLAQRSD